MHAVLLAVVLSAAPRTIVIVPLGKVDVAFIDAASAALKARVDADVRVDPARELPKAAWYAPRKRWRAERILDVIDADPPQDAWKVLVITSAEISTTKGDVADWGIAGLGNIGALSSVASTFLYTKHSRVEGAGDPALHRRRGARARSHAGARPLRDEGLRDGRREGQGDEVRRREPRPLLPALPFEGGSGRAEAMAMTWHAARPCRASPSPWS